MIIMLCACFYTKGLVSMNRSCYSNYFLLVTLVCSVWKQPACLKGSDLWVFFCCVHLEAEVCEFSLCFLNGVSSNSTDRLNLELSFYLDRLLQDDRLPDVS